MNISELRNRVEFNRWCRMHPEVDMYHDRTGCGTPVMLCLLFVVCLLVGCKTKFVPVVEVHEQHHWHTDSVRHTDSTYHEKETIVMQLDSASMARYGIQLQSAERAWLVRTAELERQLQQLERMTNDRDSVHDSIPVPFPVEVVKEVPKDFNWIQEGLMWLGGATLILGIGLLVFKLKKKVWCKD